MIPRAVITYRWLPSHEGAGKYRIVIHGATLGSKRVADELTKIAKLNPPVTDLELRFE